MTTIFFSHLSTEANTVGKAWNTTDFPQPVGKLTYTSTFSSTICRIASSWCLLSFSKPKISHTLTNAWSSELSPSSAILFSRGYRDPHVKPTRVSSTKIRAEFWLVKKYWRHGNRFAARDRRRYFSEAREATTGNASAVRRLRLAVRKWSFLFPRDTTWPSSDKGSKVAISRAWYN